MYYTPTQPILVCSLASSIFGIIKVFYYLLFWYIHATTYTDYLNTWLFPTEDELKNNNEGRNQEKHNWRNTKHEKKTQIKN
jgi:hypothetical protein